MPKGTHKTHKGRPALYHQPVNRVVYRHRDSDVANDSFLVGPCETFLSHGIVTARLFRAARALFVSRPFNFFLCFVFVLLSPPHRRLGVVLLRESQPRRRVSSRNNGSESFPIPPTHDILDDTARRIPRFGILYTLLFPLNLLCWSLEKMHACMYVFPNHGQSPISHANIVVCLLAYSQSVLSSFLQSSSTTVTRHTHTHTQRDEMGWGRSLILSCSRMPAGESCSCSLQLTNPPVCSAGGSGERNEVRNRSEGEEVTARRSVMQICTSGERMQISYDMTSIRMLTWVVLVSPQSARPAFLKSVIYLHIGRVSHQDVDGDTYNTSAMCLSAASRLLAKLSTQVSATGRISHCTTHITTSACKCVRVCVYIHTTFYMYVSAAGVFSLEEERKRDKCLPISPILSRLHMTPFR